MTSMSNNINELHKCNTEQKKVDTKDYILYEKLLYNVRTHSSSLWEERVQSLGRRQRRFLNCRCCPFQGVGGGSGNEFAL